MSLLALVVLSLAGLSLLVTALSFRHAPVATEDDAGFRLDHAQ